MIVMHDPAVGTDGHIDPRLFIIFVPGFGYLDQRRSLSAADSLLLSGDTDGAAADTDLDEICSRVRKETESFRIHHISGSHLHRIAVL